MKTGIEEILVSVVIPVYNCEKWIRKTLNSVFNQSYKNIEIIIVNDGSTDKTSEILKEYEEYNNMFIYDIENSGPAIARNYGASKSKGVLIAFLDADDTWDSKKIEKQVNYFNEFDSNLLITNVKIINEHDEIIDTQEKILPKSQEQQVIHFFKGKITMNTPTIMVKKVVYDDIGGFNTELIHREDHFFLMQVAYKYGIDLLEEHLVYRRRWNESMTGDINRINEDEIGIVNFFYRTRYHFYNLSIQTFPFLKQYLSVEQGKYYNMVAMRLYRAGFINGARIQIKTAIKHNLKINYIIRYLYLHLPRILRNLILKIYEKNNSNILKRA